MSSTIRTPNYSHLKSEKYISVYEPREDTFLLIDALEDELQSIKSLNPLIVVEIGSGNGVVITALASALGSNSFYLATDINIQACRATKETAAVNYVTVQCCNMDLLGMFRNQYFDVILFNPPYVCTEGSEIDGLGIERSWAGGQDGREIIDKCLPKLHTWLSERGVCYMVVLKENNLDKIESIANEFHMNVCVVKERKVLGEHLFILKFQKTNK